ncbi:hypothetical protein [Lyngbya confervoides]|uniref:Secreted protein n=1 Tax=Lyngbya confervoides BDU141951 TaxID=1574623 RepID=A0ABD4T1E8_9CYAN|nr:hypothetical protein [Lyngbya confervoides]MCM1982354.1 hypothetical protein [Lyngbya confervoides BDU141951]
MTYLSCLLSGLAWLIVFMTGLTVFRFLLAGAQQIQQLHQIPCSRCVYFTATSCLKCTVRPDIAATELATDCADFEAMPLV